MKIKGFITHKIAEKYEDCQDYFAINTEKGRLAISDGMSQSIFPQWWAEELVCAYVDNAWVPSQNDLESLREKWNRRVHGFLEAQKQEGKPTWMLENCLIEKRGAGATLCGVCFENETDWKGYVLGDSCLIEVASNNKIVKLERSKEEAFNNNPDYFDSIVGGKGNVKKIQGSLEEGVKLLLVTDALAEFLYTQKEKGNEAEYVHQLLQLESHDEFCRLIENWRVSNHLHNDDTTLLIVEYDGNLSLNVTIADNLMELIKDEPKEFVNRIEVDNAIAINNEAIDECELSRSLKALENGIKNLPKSLKKVKKKLLCKLNKIKELTKFIRDDQTS